MSFRVSLRQFADERSAQTNLSTSYYGWRAFDFTRSTGSSSFVRCREVRRNKPVAAGVFAEKWSQ
jgi:hypothetical protein